ncbi:MAG TPA: hypothetical protein VIK81_03355 [Patescibacteria group bacterium]
MTATAHALIGASIAVKIANPLIGIPLAIVSHILADMVPHWDFGLGWRTKTKTKLFLQSSFDVLFGFGLVWLIFSSLADPIYLFVMVIAAQLPDWAIIPYWFFNWNFFPFSTTYRFQKMINHKLAFPWGLAIQFVVFILVLWATVSQSDVNNLIVSAFNFQP